MDANKNTPPMVRVWDLPTRLFHWLLVFSFALAWITSEGDAWLGLHVLAGSMLLGLIAFRLVWGFVGSRHARFSDFVKSPSEVMNYLQGVMWGNAPRVLGHNPAGGYGILALLGLGILTGLLGVLTLGTEEGHGPMAGWLPRSFGDGVEDIHEGAAILMVAVVAVHLTGVVVESLLHRENLVAAMFHGRKRAEGSDPGHGDVSRHWPVALMLVLAVVMGGGFLMRDRAGGVEGVPRILVSEALPMDDQWKKECGDCHLEFHPSLLPARSWKAMLLGGEDHFGEDLGLSAEKVKLLSAFAEAHAAERARTEAAYKILKGVSRESVPLRITETPYWKKKHREIDDATWKNAKVGGPMRCENCHVDARAATFEDDAIRMPVSVKH